MLKKIIISILICFLITAGVFLTVGIIEDNQVKEENKEYTDLQTSNVISINSSISQTTKNEPEFAMNVNWDKLGKENPDTIGWIKIPDTPVDYPVVQGEDNDYYLHHTFTGSKRGIGAIFMDYTNMYPDDMITVVYGHNMAHGRQDMFGSLLKYKEKDYFNEHPEIWFQSNKGQFLSDRWEIFAVTHVNIDKILDKSYIAHHNFQSIEEFEEAMTEIKELSSYDTNIMPNINDKLLMLSTCDRSVYGRSGRLLVWARLKV